MTPNGFDGEWEGPLAQGDVAPAVLTVRLPLARLLDLLPTHLAPSSREREWTTESYFTQSH